MAAPHLGASFGALPPNLTLQDVMASSGLDSESRWFEPVTEVAMVATFGLVVSLGVLGNALVACVLCRRGHLRRSPRHWYLLNLVVSDLLICVLCVPFTVLRLTVKDWRLGEAVCRLAPFLQQAYLLVSILTIVAIALERYRAIVCSSRQHHSPVGVGGRSSVAGAARVVIPVIWALALGLATPMALTHRLDNVYNWSVTGGNGAGKEAVVLTLCVESWGEERLLAVYTVLMLLLQYALPAAAVMALHLLICRFLRASRQQALQRPASLSSRHAGRRKAARHRKNLALLTLISLTFGLEWLPITVVNIVADIDHTVFPSARFFSLTYALCLLLALTSVFVNPVVYGCFNSNVRRDLCRCLAGGSDRSPGGGPGVAGRKGRGEGRGDSLRELGAGSSEITSRLCSTVLGSSSAAAAAVAVVLKQQRSVSLDSSIFSGGSHGASGDKGTLSPTRNGHPGTPQGSQGSQGAGALLSEVRRLVRGLTARDADPAPVPPSTSLGSLSYRVYRQHRCRSVDAAAGLMTSHSRHKVARRSLQFELECVTE